MSTTFAILIGCLAFVEAVPLPNGKEFPGYGPQKKSIDEMFSQLNTGPTGRGKKSGEHLTELDIMVPAEGGRKKRAAGVFGLWPGGRIPYVFDFSFPAADSRFLTAFNDAKALFETKTCLRLVPHTTESQKITIVSDGGCWSYIGKLNNGDQKLSLLAPASPNGGSCWYKGIIAHEFIHAAGFLHEQSRGDRDSHVTIITTNIQAGKENNFAKMSNWVDMNSPYDYTSVMHYGKKSFSKNGGITIQTVDPQYQDIIGQRADISDLDAAQLNMLYSDECGLTPPTEPTPPPTEPTPPPTKPTPPPTEPTPPPTEPTPPPTQPTTTRRGKGKKGRGGRKEKRRG